MRKIIFFSLLAIPLWAEGPVFQHKDTYVNQEFQNSYQDIRTVRARQNLSSAVPTRGTWSRGSIIWNDFSVNTTTAAWVCVAGGTPGTWKVIPAN